MQLLLRLLTWVDRRIERSVTRTCTTLAALLTRMLKRGPHRAWRAGRSTP